MDQKNRRTSLPCTVKTSRQGRAIKELVDCIIYHNTCLHDNSRQRLQGFSMHAPSVSYISYQNTCLHDNTRQRPQVFSMHAPNANYISYACLKIMQMGNKNKKDIALVEIFDIDFYNGIKRLKKRTLFDR